MLQIGFFFRKIATINVELEGTAFYQGAFLFLQIINDTFIRSKDNEQN